MNKQFTASEVRDAARNYNGDTAAPLNMLRAFADLLEAQEKAVPVAYAEFTDGGCIRMWSRQYEERLPGTRMIPLYIHSAQAQPPAASVTDAMQELADKYHELLWAVARKFPGETRHETALRYIREAECQEAALAAQENPNG